MCLMERYCGFRRGQTIAIVNFRRSFENNIVEYADWFQSTQIESEQLSAMREELRIQKADIQELKADTKALKADTKALRTMMQSVLIKLDVRKIEMSRNLRRSCSLKYDTLEIGEAEG